MLLAEGQQWHCQGDSLSGGEASGQAWSLLQSHECNGKPFTTPLDTIHMVKRISRLQHLPKRGILWDQGCCGFTQRRSAL